MQSAVKFVIIGLLLTIGSSCAISSPNYYDYDGESVFFTVELVIVHRCNNNVPELPQILNGNQYYRRYQTKCLKL